MKYYQNIKHILAIGLLPVLLSTSIIACSSKKELEEAKNKIVKNDLDEKPQSMSQQENTILDTEELYKKMYTEGCSETGKAAPKLQTHPQLKTDNIFSFLQTKEANGKNFKIKYELNVNNAEEPSIGLAGTISETSLTGYKGMILNRNNSLVTKKCYIPNNSISFEKCTETQIDYSHAFLTEFNKNFDSNNCQISDEEMDILDSWSTADYKLEDQTKVLVYVNRHQAIHYKRCGTNPLEKVIKTTVTATSNDIVSMRFNHCGGETIYKKITIRDEKTGELVSQESNSILIAPVVQIL